MLDTYVYMVHNLVAVHRLGAADDDEATEGVRNCYTSPDPDTNTVASPHLLFMPI